MDKVVVYPDRHYGWRWRVERDGITIKEGNILYTQLSNAKVFAKLENPGTILEVRK